jgi:hypothetical protein
MTGFFRWFFTLSLTLSLLAFIGGCGDDDGSSGPSGPAAGSNTETIPPEGGSVTYENAAVDIPEGALDEETEISVGIPESAPSYTQPANTEKIGDVYEFGPAGTQFNLPVTVTIQYNDSDIGSHNENTLKLLTFEDGGDTPAELANVVVDTENNIVSGDATHFSFFVLSISTGGGGGGGDLEGTWIYERTDYTFTDPDPSFMIEMWGWGEDAWFTITGEEWESQGTQFIRTKVTSGGQVLYDETTSFEYHSRGTYTVDGNTFTTTITWSEFDPESVGYVQETEYYFEGDYLVILYQDEQQGYSVNVESYYLPQ